MLGLQPGCCSGLKSELYDVQPWGFGDFTSLRLAVYLKSRIGVGREEGPGKTTQGQGPQVPHTGTMTWPVRSLVLCCIPWVVLLSLGVRGLWKPRDKQNVAPYREIL